MFVPRSSFPDKHVEASRILTPHPLQDGKDYDPRAGYGQSNAARTMFAKLLAEKLQGENIRVFSVDPGGT
jgi:NAD(P)-dependent dehydrogenase (short-subunit alcohol dehydrogenase family)